MEAADWICAPATNPAASITSVFSMAESASSGRKIRAPRNLSG
jgi:hypothetical protein